MLACVDQDQENFPPPVKVNLCYLPPTLFCVLTLFPLNLQQNSTMEENIALKVSL